MPRPSLSNSRKTAAKTVTDKITGKGSKSTNNQNIPVVDNSKQYHQQFNTVLTQVPGLEGINPNVIKDMLPQFQETSYAISDPLNPPENAPQVTEAQYDKGIRINEGMQRALKLTGAAFDTTQLRFTVIGKQAKAFGAGVKAATEFEKVRGDFFDYQSQIETNLQKSETLDVNRHRTSVARTQSVADKISLDEQLKQSEVDAQLNQAKTADKLNKLEELKKKLGQVA